MVPETFFAGDDCTYRVLASESAKPLSMTIQIKILVTRVLLCGKFTVQFISKFEFIFLFILFQSCVPSGVHTELLTPRLCA